MDARKFTEKSMSAIGAAQAQQTSICVAERLIYNHSGDDGKEDPPVPIPNTEVKLFYAESTCS